MEKIISLVKEYVIKRLHGTITIQFRDGEIIKIEKSETLKV